MLETVKFALTKLGAQMSEDGLIRRFDAALNYLEVGRWMRDRGFQPGRRFRTREEVFNIVGRRIADEQVLYLEFGVWKGESIRFWSGLLRNPASHLHGFDSFEGLPEKWHATKDRGCFSTGGVLPDVDDDRVQFFKGWFRDTLPLYVPPTHDRLVINIDADLYSSTVEVLRRFVPLIRAGTFLYFDELSDRNHELKAFDEFLTATRQTCRVVAATRTLSQVMFEVVE